VSDFLAELRDELLDGLERDERPARWRRGLAVRRRGWIRPARRMAVAAVAVAVAIALAVQVADRAPQVEPGITPPVSRLDGFHATSLVAADGSLWVTQYDLARLLRIDSKTGKVAARIDVGGSPGGVITAAGAVWLHDWERGRVLKVDPRTNRVVKTLKVGTNNSDIAFAAGSIWTIDPHGELLRVDPNTAAVTRRLSLGTAMTLPSQTPIGSTLAAAGHTLWVIAGDGDIAELDARTARILGRAHGPALPVETSRRAVADNGGLWISSPLHRQIIHIDARTLRVTYLRVHGDPGPLAIVDGRIWVGTLHDTGPVTRITILETDGRIVTTIPLPAEPAVNVVPAPDGGAWVTFGTDRTVRPAALRISSP
jgi:DNA-binding beta-propeller fold protein YncE